MLLGFCSAARGAIALAPGYYGDNMVLQLEEDGSVRLAGVASPKARVRADYKELHDNDRADDRGLWEIKLRLGRLKDFGPGELTFTEIVGKNELPAKILRNVVVGKVWWLGFRGRGLPATAQALARCKDDRIRIVDLPDSGAFGQWFSCAEPGTSPPIINAFCSEAATHLGPGYVGIVQTSAEMLNGLGISHAGGDKAKSMDWLNPTQELLNRAVRKEQDFWHGVLVDAKHAGIVTNPPVPVTYGVPRVLWPDKNFSPLDPKVKEFWRGKDFEAAIW